MIMRPNNNCTFFNLIMRLSIKWRGGGVGQTKESTQSNEILHNFRVYIPFLLKVGYKSYIGIVLFVPNS